MALSTSASDIGFVLIDFQPDEEAILLAVASDLAERMGGADSFRHFSGGITVRKQTISQNGLANAGSVTLNAGLFAFPPADGNPHWTIAHELAHAIDLYNGKLFSRGLVKATGGKYNPLRQLMYHLRLQPDTLPGTNAAGYEWGGTPPKGADCNFNPLEDFAESVAAYLYPDAARQFITRHFAAMPDFQYGDFRATQRGMYIDALFRRMRESGHSTA